MKGTQTCINKVIKAIKVVQHLGDGSSSSKTKADKKGDDIFDQDDSPRAPHEATSSKHVSWAAKCIKAGGKGKASADRLLKAAKGRTLSQVMSQTSKRLEPPSYAHAHHGHHPPSTSVRVDHKPPPRSISSKSVAPSKSGTSTSDPPLQILMWIGDQHIDIGKTLVPY